ncbi:MULTISPECIES: hypothetical protein [unclassified Luteimonas]|uniref:hypothetical protein n=1 Tax=unclassified Luteimonas TaxID=2629088 RepID=UPI0018F0D950|nr:MULTISPECIES: hypothetical protein [unclassified Luteimonas]MBJ6979431.1 hypothetical protein [Luteimonas sp. MC1895]MBJ6984357.1 hypothetical protein [Luteimonas sp. MC1750]QQO05022.1 hypothetical protein JGR68_09040 [Luteimonas sp. MC1750]
MLPLLGACQSQVRSGSAPPSAVTVLEIAQAHYQPAGGAGGSDAEAAACRAWSLDAQQAEAFFGISEQLPEGGLHDFSWLPCSIKGRLQAEGREWAFEINAAGTSTWRSREEVRLLGCSRSTCEPFVILMPERSVE